MENSKGRGSESIQLMWIKQIGIGARQNAVPRYFGSPALTYLAVLFNFNSLYLKFAQTAFGVNSWESQPIVHVIHGGSRRMDFVLVWKQNGDVLHWLAVARRGGSS